MNKKVWAIAIALDLFDFIIGWIPIAGDVIDVVGMFAMFPFIGTYALIDLVELIPFADFLPINIVAVYLASHDMLGLGRR